MKFMGEDLVDPVGCEERLPCTALVLGTEVSASSIPIDLQREAQLRTLQAPPQSSLPKVN